MKNKSFFKKILTTLIMAGILLIANEGEVKASLQANPNTQYIKADSPVNWMRAFRQMEKPGEAMGLAESLNEDLTTSGESNDRDVHLMRATEYGASALLSASGYGNPRNDQMITSTTGNKTGVIVDLNGKWEWVAGGLKGSIFPGTDERYYDTYDGAQTSARRGDALGNATTTNPGCASWHSVSIASWVSGNWPYFIRGAGGLFSFSDYRVGDSDFGRGVAVCSAGLLYRMGMVWKLFWIRGESFKEFFENRLYIKET